MPNRDELQGRTVAELRDLASDAEIEGRSSMSKDELVAALADDSGRAVAAPEQTEQQQAVNDRRTGIDPRLVEAKAATREREAELARPSAVEEPVRVVGAETFQAAREATRQAEADAAGSVREAPAEV